MIYTYLAGAFGVIGVLCLIGARMKKTKRVSFIWALVSAASAAAAAWQQVFWVPMVRS